MKYDSETFKSIFGKSFPGGNFEHTHTETTLMTFLVCIDKNMFQTCYKDDF